jgi:hypothetical protein
MTMITGNLINLRAYDQGDLSYLAELRNDFALQGILMALPRANSIDKTHAWLKSKSGQEDSVFFVISEKQSNETESS